MEAGCNWKLQQRCWILAEVNWGADCKGYLIGSSKSTVEKYLLRMYLLFNSCRVCTSKQGLGEGVNLATETGLL